MRRGTHAKALRILQKAVDKLGGLESSPPILLHAYSTAQQLTAAITADRKIRARHFKSAIEASRQATEIAPDSVALAHSYATLLLGASRDMDDDDAIVAFPSIIAECKRGIQIKEPSDPAFYDLGQRDSEHMTADVLAALHELKQLVSEDLQGMKRYKETKLKIVDFQKQQHVAASDSPPLITGQCADQRKDGLEQSYEVINDSGKCADREASEEIFSTTDAHPNKQEEETQAEETVEKLNPKHFSEQSRSTSAPSELDGAIPSEIVRIQDQDDNDYDRRFLEDLRQSIAVEISD